MHGNSIKRNDQIEKFMTSIFNIISNRVNYTASDIASNPQQYLQQSRITNARNLLGFINNSNNSTGVQTANASNNKSVDTILKEQEYNTKYLNFINNAIARINYVSTGQIQPTQDWEEQGAGLQLSGQPFRIIVNAKGGIEVIAQGDAVQNGVSASDVRVLNQKNDELQELIKQQNLVNTRTKLRTTLANAIYRVAELQNYYPPKSALDFELQRTITSGAPFKIELDKNGNPIVSNQFDSNFLEIGYAYRKKLTDQIKLYKQALNIEKGITTLPAYDRPYSLQETTATLTSGSNLSSYNAPVNVSYSYIEITGIPKGVKLSINGVEQVPVNDSYQDGAGYIRPKVVPDIVKLSEATNQGFDAISLGAVGGKSFTSAVISGFKASEELRFVTTQSLVGQPGTYESYVSIPLSKVGNTDEYFITLTAEQLAKDNIKYYRFDENSKDIKFSFVSSDSPAPESITKNVTRGGYYDEGNFGLTTLYRIQREDIRETDALTLTGYSESNISPRIDYKGLTNTDTGEEYFTNIVNSPSKLIQAVHVGSVVDEGANLGYSDIAKKAQISLGNLEWKDNQKFVLISDLNGNVGFRDKYGDFTDRYVKDGVVALGQEEAQSGLKLNLDDERTFTITYAGDDGAGGVLRRTGATFNNGLTTANFSFDANQVADGEILALNINGYTFTQKRLAGEGDDSFKEKLFAQLENKGIIISNKSNGGFTATINGDVASSFADKVASHKFTDSEINANPHNKISLVEQTVNAALNSLLGFGLNNVRTALGLYEGKTPFYFDINDYGYLTVKRLSYNNVLPKFLKDSKDAPPKTNDPQFQKALDLYTAAKPFYFDLQGSRVTVKELNAQNLNSQKLIQDALKTRRSAVVSLIT